MRTATTFAASAIAAAALTVVVPSARAEQIYAILNNQPATGETLVTIDSTTGAVTSSVLLQTPNTLTPIGSIDVRPGTGELYGLGSVNNQLYKINPTSGALTTVGAPLPVGGLIDFNPTVDRIRVISGTTNLRVNPDTAAVTTDTPLSYSPGDVNAGTTPNVIGIGYTNSVAGATTTTLYDIVDGANAAASNDTLATQNPANSGTLQTRGLLGVNVNTGPFGPSGFVGFDVSGASGTAFLSDGQFAGASNLYTVDLTTGIASSPRAITGLPGGTTVAEIAVAAVPEPASLGLAAVAAAGLLGRRRGRRI